MTHTAHDNRRAQRRVPIELLVTLVDDAGHSHSVTTRDISVNGMFLGTHNTSPFRLRQLVQVQFEIPDTGEIAYLLAMVIRLIHPADALDSNHPPGLGLHLYGLDHKRRADWEAFVERMLAEYNRLFADVPSPMPSPTPQTQHPSTLSRSEYVVHFADVVDLAAVMTWDFIYGAMFLETDRVAPRGTPVRLLLVHPDDRAEFPIPGTVAHTHPTGMSIELDGMTPKHLTLFKEFVELGVPELDLGESCEPAWLVCEDEEEDEVAA
ncbi:MAG: hypothetical protein CMH57_07385 [Myxococcales bacterium]|nr:hypothetical protein [Myxococcales bacterium]